MARYQIILRYDGTDFYGSQRQGSKRTVQGEIEKSLFKIGWKGKSILLAGRTDSGVHAVGQVAVFELDWRHDTGRLLKAINANLPADLAAVSIQTVPETFHPRFDAFSRCYRYRLFCGEQRNPLRERYAWRVWPTFSDLTHLARYWVGKHDFSSFGSATSEQGSTIRTVISAEWIRNADEWTFEIVADAFLYRMIRRLVYVQVAVGQGRVDEEILKGALADSQVIREDARKLLPPGTAVPNGLVLAYITYESQV